MRDLIFLFKNVFFLVIVTWCSACAPKLAPYANGPVMSQKHIKKTFQPILAFMDVRPGIAFADVGAGSGALTVMMTSLLENSTIYVQDIDKATLQPDNLDKIIDFYSKQGKQDLRKKNKYVLTLGDHYHSQLPDGSIDRIFTNGTIHVFDSMDSMIADMRRKLKPDGLLFIREGFSKNSNKVENCADSKCGRPKINKDNFMATMKRNGFKLVKQSPDMSGYPVFGFAVDR